MSGFRITEGQGGVTFAVRVVPRARRNQLGGLHGEALKVRLTAPPVEGAANKALCSFLAEQLGVRSGAVEIISGHTSRQKVVRVNGVSADEVRQFLGGN
jgi:uncharacterized protein (TIGR00251 family)